jgi:C-terminal processing protease CtpA/Prc
MPSPAALTRHAACILCGLCDLLSSQNFVAPNHSSSLNVTTKIDASQTTLGVILTNNHVDGVLPGGPAYLAGLRQGDRIVAVSSSVDAACVRASAHPRTGAGDGRRTHDGSKCVFKSPGT